MFPTFTIRRRVVCRAALFLVLCQCALVSRAADAPGKEVDVTGRYACLGESPAGLPYRGTVDISKKGDTYDLDWTVGQESYRGVGILSGGVLSASWKMGTASGLVVYKVEKIDSGLKLSGKWCGNPSNGKLLKETLTSLPN